MSPAVLLVAVPAVPLMLAASLVVRRARRIVSSLLPLAALPGVVLALAPAMPGGAFSRSIVGQTTVELPWVLFDVSLGVSDEIARTYLLFTAILWGAAGWFAITYMRSDPRRHVFDAFWLLTMAGNLTGIVALDVASFYAFYAMMSLASYGLVVHERSELARRAARVYLILALFGDVLILAAVLFVLGEQPTVLIHDIPRTVAGSPARGWIVGLVLAGFGVKVGGVLPLHVWLPLAHPVAPTPASALLSGTMVKMGVLGWLRFLPLGHVALSSVGHAWSVLGIAASVYAAVVGASQNEPKTVLAYSTVSQLGLVMAPIGAALATPELAGAATAAVLLFATHHAVAKATLFLGTAVARDTQARWASRLVAIGLLWAALQIAAAPLSSGALAKASFKIVLASASGPSASIGSALSVAAVGSTLLMLRYLSLTAPRGEPAGTVPRIGLWLPWASLLVLDVLWVLSMHADEGAAAASKPGALWASAWPILAGVLLGITLQTMLRRSMVRLPAIPPGDVLFLLRSVHARVIAQTRAAIGSHELRAGHPIRPLQRGRFSVGALLTAVARSERRLGTFRTAGLLALLLLALSVALLGLDNPP